MEDYTPNSHRFKAEEAEKQEKKIEKVIEGDVNVRKKSGLSKAAKYLISDDAKNVKGYILYDVVLPSVKKTIHDIITNFADMIFNDGKKSKNGSSSPRVSYRSYYDKKDDEYDKYSYRNRSVLDFDDIVYGSRGDAERVLNGMIEVLDTYRVVTIADMYDLSGETFPHTYNKYGWTSLRTADVVRVRDGYTIALPNPKPIE